MGAKLMVLAAAGYLFWTWTPFNQDQKNYIDKYKGLAIIEMERTGVPASIKMAQALLESNSGKSDLARRGNNHFGIKCHNGWNGDAVYKKDDDFENGKLVESCFRSYPSVEGSYRDHSNFLRNGRRYQFLFELEPTNYEGWAKGLKKAGYATSQYYHKTLISLIERYRLYELDQQTSEEVPVDLDPIVESPNPITPAGKFLTINDVKYVLAGEGETLESVADRVKYSSKRLLRYNEGIPKANFNLDGGDVVFIQPKRRNWRGRQKYHTVTGDETMYDISQRYGIHLARLYKRNKLVRGEEPQEGAQIKIRGSSVKEPPQLREKPVVIPEEDFFLDEEVFPYPDEDDPISNSPGTRESSDPVLEPPIEVTLPEPVYHVVQSGETLWSISQKYGVKVEVIKEFNALSDDDLYQGMRLRIK